MAGPKLSPLDALKGALEDAEAKIQEDSGQNLNDLREVLNDYLRRGDEPERKRLLREYERGGQLTGPHGIRRKLGAIDMEFFGRAYFGHYFSRPSPDFHRDLDAIWRDGVLQGRYPLTGANVKIISRLPGSRRVVAAPRGHAKSTNLTFKGTMHAVLYGYKHYPIIISDSSEQAEGFLESIRVELEDNAAIREDFGELAGPVWRSNVLVTRTNIKIEAIGSGKKIRGRKHRNWRPDLVILDDVENDENVRTPEQRRKLRDWFNKAVSKAGDDYTDIVYIGTLLHYDSLLANTLRNPAYQAIKYKAVISWSKADALWREWEALYTDLDRAAHALAYFEGRKAEMLAGTEVLWEAKLSYYDLMCIRISEGESSFNSELQNEPINPDDCIFVEEWLDYYNDAEILHFLALSTPVSAKPKIATTRPLLPLPSTRRPGTCMSSTRTSSGGIPTGSSRMCCIRRSGCATPTGAAMPSSGPRPINFNGSLRRSSQKRRRARVCTCLSRRYSRPPIR